MKVRNATYELSLPGSPEDVFPFFADAFNLEAITPAFLRFKVVTPAPIDMQTGTLIDYSLRLRGVPIRWRTEIAAWEPPFRFVDRQLRGPYRLWEHEHTFERDGDRTIARDHVRYAHLGGPLVHKLLVRPDVDRIFAYRQQKLIEILGRPKSDAPAGAALTG